jgi:hypothetical protein
LKRLTTQSPRDEPIHFAADLPPTLLSLQSARAVTEDTEIFDGFGLAECPYGGSLKRGFAAKGTARLLAPTHASSRQVVQCALNRADRTWRSGRALLCPRISDVNLFRYRQRIVYFDAEISNGAFDLGMAKQGQDGP